MATKMLLIETETFKVPAELWPNAQRIHGKQGLEDFCKEPFDEKTAYLVVAPTEMRTENSLQNLVLQGKGIVSVAYFANAKDCTTLANITNVLGLESRSTGVKNFLNKGSTIFYESFFNANGVGEKLDPCFRFARSKLNVASSLDSWGSLQALLFLGLQSLPNNGEAGTGERVDVQIGGDDHVLTFSVKFDLAIDQIAEFRNHPLLQLPKNATDLMEIRYIQSAKKIEVLCVFLRSENPETSVEVQTFHADSALEAKEDAQGFEFKSFKDLTGKNPEEKRVFKGGGFKKKFSDQVKVSGDKKAPEETTTIKGDAPVAESVTVIKGDGAKAPEQKIVVSGNADLAKSASAATEVKAATAESAAPAGKSDALLESKIQSLETTLKQREELIAKLNKEIEEIKDPMKMGVITGIKDNQVQGLKDNITRLQGELADAQAREKELMAVVDKAIQLKDDVVKKLKAAEVKLSQSSGGNNSKVVTLEKQLEEQKRQNKELSKKVSQLTEQLTGKAA